MTRSEMIAIDIINLFEDFLEARDVRIPSSDKAMKEEGAFDGNEARIYGDDFAELEEAIADIVEIYTVHI